VSAITRRCEARVLTERITAIRDGNAQRWPIGQQKVGIRNTLMKILTDDNGDGPNDAESL